MTASRLVQDFPLSDLTYRVELTPPDIEPYRRGQYRDRIRHELRRGRAGPHVLVTALTHGNEICGAIALDRLLRAGVRPRRGRLTLAFDNVAAYREFDPRYPIASRYVDEDFNRLWSPATLDGPRQSIELERARALRPVVDSRRLPARPAFDAIRHRAADAGRAAAALARVGAAGRHPRADHVRRRPRRRAADARLRRVRRPGSPKTALLIECGQHWERRAAEVATDVMLRFLIALGVVTRDDVAALGGPDFDAHPRQRVIEVTEAVTITGDRFEFAGDFRGLEVLRKEGHVDRPRRRPRGAHALRRLRADHAVAPPRQGPDRRAPRALTSTDGAAGPASRPGARPRKSSFPPIVDARSRVLVLGTLPGEESLRRREYYAHPRNLFWPIVFGAVRRQPAAPITTERVRFVLRARHRAMGRLRIRPSGVPAPIRRSAREMPNAIPELLQSHPAIRAVAFNGSTARRLYDRHFARRPDLVYLALPSTSPAHARLGFAEKLAQWSALRQVLGGG